jgi:hypothetical protein
MGVEADVDATERRTGCAIERGYVEQYFGRDPASDLNLRPEQQVGMEPNLERSYSVTRYYCRRLVYDEWQSRNNCPKEMTMVDRCIAAGLCHSTPCLPRTESALPGLSGAVAFNRFANS